MVWSSISIALIKLTNRGISLLAEIWPFEEFLFRLSHRRWRINWLKSKRKSRYRFSKSSRCTFIYLIQPLNSIFDQYIYQDVCENKSWTNSKQCLICRLKFFCSNFPKFQMNILLYALCLLIKVKIKVINAIFNWYRMMTLFLTFVFRIRQQRRCVWTTIFGVFVLEMNKIYAFRLNYKNDFLFIFWIRI